MTITLSEAWRTRTAVMRERLTAEQIEALGRARSGYPPATILGWPLATVSLEPTLAVIESVGRTLAECFPWPAPADLPGDRHWADLRHETNELTNFAGELREAMAGGNAESALLRAMALGTMFTRLAYLLFDGAAIASGAASRRRAPAGPEQRKANADEYWCEVLPRLDKIERAIRPEVKRDERWRHVFERYKKAHGEQLPKAAAQKRLRAWRKTADIRP